MKAFGQILAGIAVMVLAWLAIWGITSVSTNNTNNNNNQNTTTTLSIEEARELVDKAYNACKGDSSVSTAAAYDKEYVDVNDCELVNICTTLFARVDEILKKVDEKNGYIKYVEDGGVVYVSYVLTEFGIKCELFWIMDDLIYSRSYIDLNYDNNNKNSWAFTLSMIRAASGVFNNDETEQLFNEYLDKIDVCGVDTKIRKFELCSIDVNQSFYENKIMIKDNVQIVNMESFDTIKHESLKKQYADSEHQDYLSNDDAYENMTDAEINQLATSLQNYVKETYTRKISNLDQYVEINK